ncbi:MAG TPA: glycosyltransferase family 4 protein [Ktedonobacterales bacterium]
MRIVICNKYYFMTGGPERYMFGVTRALEAQGHEVIPFSVDAKQNEPTKYSRYFISSPVGRENYGALLTQKKLGVGAKVKMAGRAIYSREAYRKLRRLIHDTQADLVYVLNFTSYMSPSIIDAAHDAKIPVVVRLSSFDLLCAGNTFLRDGQICTDCLTHGKSRGIMHRCTGGSLSASVARVGAMYYHDVIDVYSRVDAYVAPARFMRQKLIEGGFPADRIHYIPTFVDTRYYQPRPQGTPDEGYVLYFGRLAPDKGVRVLVEAYGLLGPSAPPLLLMGYADPSEEQYLRQRCTELGLTNVHFLPPREGDAMVSTIQRARCVVAPSVWFDNTPNTVYEALACGRPVIASDIGSLKEQVVDEQTGLLFEMGNPKALASQIVRLLRDPSLADRLGANAVRTIQRENSIDSHLRQLLALFGALTSSETAMSRPSSTHQE